jgi:serine/threonine protein kinase
MTVAEHRLAKKIFACAKGLERVERLDFLDKSCEGDAALRREVEVLLELDDELESAERAAACPTEIGNFDVLRRLGEGGMGEVWEAEQQAPVRRRVALKLVKWGMDTRHVLARFEIERQALALMSHPNIAMVYEAGATEDGRPYFAMEFVDGPNIIEYCDEYCLSILDRLKLFSQVCSGVQHAHQKGVIHRDLKPSNVLVSHEDGEPVPKIIDFGIAKAISRRLTECTIFTELGQWIGTPEYMSPEQAEVTGGDVDTRSDVYSLGVLLYELIAGAPPIDGNELREAGFDEMRRRIREEDPPKPSTRVSRMGPASVVAAARRRTDTAGLMRELRGDLDWIVLKALEKDRSRRYGSPAEFAEDIARHLRDEPVAAGPPSAIYRIRKYVRRNRLAVAAASLVFVALLAAVIGTTLGMNRARREAETARRVAKFLETTIIDLSPRSRGGQTSSPREILDRGLERVRVELAHEPLARARVLMALGVSYGGLGEHDEARKLLEESAAIRRQLLGPVHSDYATSLFQLGDLLFDLQDDEEAKRIHSEALAIREKVLPPGHPDTIMSLERLAIAHFMTDGCDQSLAISERVGLLTRDGDGIRNPDVESALSACGALAVACGDLELARSLLEQTAMVREGSAGPDSFTKARILLNYSATLDWLGESEKALPYVERGVAILEDLGGPQDRAYYLALDIAGAVNLHTGHLDRARELLERVVAAESTVIENFPDFELTLYNLAAVLARQGDTEQALRLLEQALDTGFARGDIFEEPGFDSLRGDPEFKAVCNEIRRRIEVTGGGAGAPGDRTGTTLSPNS